MNKRKIAVLIVVNIVAVCYVFFNRVNEYSLYKNYHNKRYKVVDAYKSHGRYGSGPMMLTLSNEASINGGYSNWIVGDTFVNEVPYNHITGISGYAYFYLPNETLLLFSGLLAFLITFVYGLLLVSYVGYKAYKWLNYYEVEK